MIQGRATGIRGPRRSVGLLGTALRSAIALAILLLGAAIPASAGVGDTLISVINRVEATYQDRNLARDSARAEALVWLRLQRERAELELTQSADRSKVTAGDTIGYNFVARNRGGAASGSTVFSDTLPASLLIIAGTLLLDGDALGENDFTVTPLGDDRRLLTLPLGELEPGGERVIEFQGVVVANDSTVRSISNTGRLVDGEDAAVSNTVEIEVELPVVSLEIELLGDSRVYVGDRVVFEIRYRNISNVRAPNAVLLDFLPAEMVFISATPEPLSLDDGPEEGEPPTSNAFFDELGMNHLLKDVAPEADWAGWSLGTLVPGQEGRAYVEAYLYRLPEGGDNLIRNRAMLSVGANGYSMVVAAAAAAVTAADPADGAVSLKKQAGLLEVGLGEAVPYALEVENTGSIPLHGLVIRDRLPASLSLVAESIQGADSASTSGNETVFHLPGLMLPGEVAVVRYTAVAVGAPGDAVANVAVAEAADGRVASDTASAWVRIRRGPALPSKTLVGKVWVDENRNGRQDPGEEGLGGVDIWTTDGQVVRTDREGRFSLQDLEPGRYTLRLDMTGLGDRYEVASRGGEVQEARLDGWTAGRADFRLVPRRVVVDYHAGPPSEVLGLVAKGAVESVVDDVVRVGAARDSADRAAERRLSLINGPGIEITSPADGSVVAGRVTYVGVRGEAGRPVALVGRDGVIQEGVIRPDGIFDFIGISLEEGPNLLKVRTTNSWGQERWDSISVHRSGLPARIELVSGPRFMYAESPETDTLQIRLIDEWGVPVVTEPVVVVEPVGVTVEGGGDRGGSAGIQLRADRAGWLRLPVRGGDRAGAASIRIYSEGVRSEVALNLLPPLRPLFATMAGRIGLGGAEEGSYASITARGALDEATSLTLNYDSRRGDLEAAAFGRAYDQLDESYLPVTGDGSQRRVLAGSMSTFSARIERGLDWAAFGDIRTEGFAGRGRLTTYDRALTGVSTRVGVGNVVVHGFGSATRQLFEEVQLRGDGSSGPYRLGGRVRPGTDRIVVELRAADNAARVLSRRELQRYVDYQIDYRTGEILLNRILPTLDHLGNHYFLVATVERLDADDRHWTGGMRVEVDARSAFDLDPSDSLTVSVFGIQDGGAVVPGGTGRIGSSLLGGEVNARLGAAKVDLEVLQARADSIGLAGRAAVEWSPWAERAVLRGEWMGVGSGFSPRQQARLRSGVEELRLGGDIQVLESVRLALDHDRQSFRDHGAGRRSSRARLIHTREERVYSVEGGLVEESRAGTGSMTSLMTRFNAQLSKDLTLWAEGRQSLSGEAGFGGGDHLGLGADLRLFDRLRLRGQHRRVSAEQPYTVSSVMLDLDAWEGGRIRGGFEGTAGSFADQGLTLGLDQRFRLPAGWSVSTQFERRIGLGDLTVTDPLRALPFAQPERDHFSVGLGAEWRGGGGERSFTARGEYYDGDLRNGHRFEAQGDIAIGRDAALLARHDWYLYEETGGLAARTDRRDHSLLGIAFRPTGSNTLNALAKVEWRRTIRPVAGIGVDPSLAGENARLIASADLIWVPSPTGAMTLRYAVRGSSLRNEAFGAEAVRSESHFFGTSLEQMVWGRFSGRVDSRLLHLKTTGDSRWSIAPALVVNLAEIELEGGYRFGNLKDIDFSGRGGLGFFASLGVRLTESSVKSAAGIWRGRLMRE